MIGDIETRLRALKTEPPSADLRRRVLQNAGRALGPVPSWTERLWGSRSLRWGWALVMICLVLGELSTGFDPGRVRGNERAGFPDYEELAREMGMEDRRFAAILKSRLDNGASGGEIHINELLERGEPL